MTDARTIDQRLRLIEIARRAEEALTSYLVAHGAEPGDAQRRAYVAMIVAITSLHRKDLTHGINGV